MFLTILLWVLWVLLGIVGLLLAYFIFVFICSLFVDMKKEYERESKFYRFLLNSSTFIMTKLVRIKVHVTGAQLLPKGRYLLVSNHRSNFDPLLTWLAFSDCQLTFISKPENFKVPIFGRIIHRLCFMAIDRENPRNAVKTINRAVELIDSDLATVAVYPEGTRNREEGLLPFHNAMFKIAQKANVPVVVMTVKGTYKIQKNYPLHRSHVYIDVVKVIGADEVKAKKTAALGDAVRDIMLENLNEGE